MCVQLHIDVQSTRNVPPTAINVVKCSVDSAVLCMILCVFDQFAAFTRGACSQHQIHLLPRPALGQTIPSCCGNNACLIHCNTGLVGHIAKPQAHVYQPA